MVGNKLNASVKGQSSQDHQASNFPRKNGGFLFSWPWENLGSFKYLLYGPFIAELVGAYILKEKDENECTSISWCTHIIILCSLRGLVHQLWSSFNNSLFFNRNRRLSQRGVDFNQIDNEWHWDNFLLLQAYVGSMAYLAFSSTMSNLPIWDTRGIISCIILHIILSEPIYYWFHRVLHESSHLFTNYHWLHHSSKVPHPFTAGHMTFLEHLVMCVIIGVPVLGTALIGYGSISMLYGYVLVFDFLRCLGHSNVEVVPHQIFHTFPLLKYIIYTPTYHNIHHRDMRANYCLFMPLYDMIGNTMNISSWDLHREVNSTKGKQVRVPDFVFLAHVVDITASMHSPFVFRSFSSIPLATKPFLIILWPGAFLVMLAMWVKSKTFLVTSYYIKGNLQQTWVVPRFGFQYFLPFATDGINKLIEQAILKADKIGVEVISLAALNKNESLNGGGTLFVKRLPNLKVRVVHGNTLTAAVILHEIPSDEKEVFLVGSTSKLGRAIALYLAQRRVRVLMLTQSNERFASIQKEAPTECQKYLVQVTKCQAAQHCKTWIVGKWITPRQQSWAPRGTHFHQFVVPPMIPFRRDCTYGKLAAMKLPEDVEGLGSCEYTMGRGVVHACHAGGVVHFLEGWKHHEVGAIDVDQIDVVWKAALRHGLKPC